MMNVADDLEHKSVAHCSGIISYFHSCLKVCMTGSEKRWFEDPINVVLAVFSEYNSNMGAIDHFNRLLSSYWSHSG